MKLTMKLNKILMISLGCCGVLVPFVLSSCSTNSTRTSIDYNSKQIPVPCPADLYDSNNTKPQFANMNPTSQYYIENVNQWFQNELIDGRNYRWDKSTYEGGNGTQQRTTEYFSITNYISHNPTSSNPLFKNVEEFYAWVRSSTINHTFIFYGNNNSNNNSDSKIYQFNDFNWSFLANPNCNVSIVLMTNYMTDTTVAHRNIMGIRIDAWPKTGSEWLVNRSDNSKNYNNTKQLIFLFSFTDSNIK